MARHSGGVGDSESAGTPGDVEVGCMSGMSKEKDASRQRAMQRYPQALQRIWHGRRTMLAGDAHSLPGGHGSPTAVSRPSRRVTACSTDSKIWTE